MKSLRRPTLSRKKAVKEQSEMHLLLDDTPMPVSAMSAWYAHGTVIAAHRHRRAQLLYAIEGVMIVKSDTGSWVVPPSRGVWLQPGVDHSVKMSGEVEMRTVFVEPGAAPHLPGRSCVVEVHALLRELILAAIDVPLDYAIGSRHDHLMHLLLAELNAMPLLPLYLPWPTDQRLRNVCERMIATPGENLTIDYWATVLDVSEKTFHRWFQRETGVTFGSWRQQARLLLALQKLAHGEKIIAVALDHGYSSQSAFTAMFKRHFGVVPSAFFS